MKFSSLFVSFSLITSFILTLPALSQEQSAVTNSSNLVKAGDKYITLIGKQVNVGEQAPNFKVVNESFSPVELNDFTGKTILISVVPSVDTGVCSLQTKRFNEEASKLSQDIVLMTISNDLPFAQKRFCQQEEIKNLIVLSDTVWRDFGKNYGLLIKDMGLLTRAVYIINSEGVIVYKELVENISSPPNYEQALQALKVTMPHDLTVDNSSTTEIETSIVPETANEQAATTEQVTTPTQ